MEKKDEEIVAMLKKMKVVEKELEEAKGAEESAYAELLMVKSEMNLLSEQQKLELATAEKRTKLLVASAKAQENSEQSIGERAKELALKTEIEELTKREEELVGKLAMLEEMNSKAGGERELFDKFKRSVMIALSKVEPEQVEAEEARQREGLVESIEVLSAMHDYFEIQNEEYEDVSSLC